MRKIIGDRKSIYNDIKIYISEFKKQILGLGIFKLILLLIGLATPLLFKVLVDNVMIEKQLDMLKWVCLGYLILYVISTVVMVFQKATSNKIFNKLTFRIRLRLWRNYTKATANFYESYNTGDLKQRIDTDTDTFQDFIGQQIIEYYYNWLLTIANGIVLVAICWKLALFGFLMVPLSFWMTKWMGNGAGKAWEAYRNNFGEYEGWLQGSLLGWKEVKALTIEKNESRIFTRYWHELSKRFFTVSLYWYGNRSFIAFKDFFITRMNLYFMGGLLIFSGDLSIGSMLVFMKYYEQFFGGIGVINDLDMQLKNYAPSLRRVVEILKIKIDLPDYVRKSNLHGDICFHNVKFRYNEEQNYVLNNFQLRIKANEQIAIVGRSGSGKTTFIKLLLGMFDPQEGEISIEGKDIKDIHPANLHKSIGVVMQDSILFNMSIKDNLLLAKPDATEDEIKAACKMAFIDEFIETLPEKYMTRIGEKGFKLSGGQKQRLAIARVLLTSPKVIVFDEATSSLDHESEKMIHKAIENISKDRTTIIIAHRLSSILSADRVIVIDKGEIVGDANHKELLGNNAVYDTLFKKQYKALKVS